jgi:hypothetical protein
MLTPFQVYKSYNILDRKFQGELIMNNEKNLPLSSTKSTSKRNPRTNPYNLFLILILLLNSNFGGCISSKHNKKVKEVGRGEK